MSMKFFISTIPFFDAQMAVHAYRFVTKAGDILFGAADDHRMLGAELLAPGLELVNEIGVEPFSGSYDLFIELTKYQLLMGMPMNTDIPPEKLVCIIDKKTLTDTAVLEKLKILKQNGYRMALDGLSEAIGIETAVKFFDYILINVRSNDFVDDMKTISPFAGETSMVLTEIPDMESFDKLSTLNNMLLSGDFYSEPITKGNVEISPLKVNSLSLLRQINEEDLDLISAANTIERDPALSISLLRFINTFNLGSGRRIDSIRHAVAILGQKEVKKWATVAISVSIGEDRPSEITKLSLIRAKFAENLAPAFDMAIKAGALFIAGLFSLLDVILQKPMEDALNEVAADSEIRDALANKKGRIYDVLSLIHAYERADWQNTTVKLVLHNIKVEVVTQAYLDSLSWYRQLLDSIDESAEEE
ncbi:MAG: HDOD domain-containing protein [Oscillospiraceae bacterium]|nr:HDOD domain-containing protein [Oscillospiraceae bacterium]